MKPKIYKTDYYVNEKKRSVTCVLRGYTECDGRVDDIRLKNEGVIDPLVWGNNRFIRDYMEFTVCATTRCTENDEFDTNIGKKIALQKAKIKLYKEIVKLNYAVHLAVMKSTLEDLRKYEKLSVSEYLEYEEKVLGIELPEKICVKSETKEYVLELAVDDESFDVIYYGEFEQDGEKYRVPVFRAETRRAMLEYLDENKDKYTILDSKEE